MIKLRIILIFLAVGLLVSQCGRRKEIKSKGISLFSPTAGDIYEPDDSSSSANSISIGETQTHSIKPSGDEDWIKFYASSGITYTIETLSSGGVDVDTYIYLYNSGLILIDSDDDSGSGLFSKIIWFCSSTEWYYVKIKGYSSGDTGDYNINVM